MEDQEAVDSVLAVLASWTGKSGGAPAAWDALQGGVEKAAAEKLIQEALQKGSPDNITVIVVALPWE